jgi:hypothetical protein
MKTTKQPLNRYELRRTQALRQLAHIEPFIEGTLSSVKRRGCRQPGWQLTFKTKGKTRTVYVPLEMAPEVKAWTQEHKRLKQLVRKVTTHSLALIRRHVAARRAARRSRASTSR